VSATTGGPDGGGITTGLGERRRGYEEERGE